MTETIVIGWRYLPWQKLLHHFKRRPDMTQAISACWMVGDYKTLKVDDDKPKCGLCEIMIDYHDGLDWLPERE